MYKIKVLKRGKVILGDLNIVLKHGDVVDLDERFPRARLDASSNLMSAIAGNDPAIAVLHKDVIIERTDADALAAMEERIKESVARQLAEIQQQKAVAPAQNTHTDISAQLAALLDAVKKGGGQSTHPSSTDEPIADDKLVDIHTRAVQRLTKNTEGHVSAEEKQIKSNAAKRAKDLEDMF